MKKVNDKGNVYQRDNVVFEICSYGKLNPDRMITYINAGTKTSGFGALLRRTLNGLYITDMFHAIPVVSWKDSTIINVHRAINGSENPFEYYFESINEVREDEVYESMFVIDARKYESYVWGEGWLSNIDGQTDEYIDLLAALIKKYRIKLKKPVREFLEKKANQLLGEKKVLGVHIRGGDRKVNIRNYANHIPISMYFDEIDNFLVNESYEKIFLATDDEEYLWQFQKKYGSMVLFYQDVKRSHDNISSFFELENTRDNNGYLLGIEVLLDIYTLLCCESMIGGPSNVTLLTRVFRKIYGNWKHFKMLDNGVCEDGLEFSKVVQSILDNNGRYELNTQ